MLSIRLSLMMIVAAVVLALAPGAARAQCTFITNPVSQTVCPGANVTFTASAVNIGGTPSYTWLRGATVVGTGATLTLTNVDAADEGSYSCRVSFGGAFPCTNTSTAATLTVRTAVGVSGQSISQTRCEGASFTPFVTASGTGPFSYQWRKGTTNLVNGGRISGADTSTLLIADLVEGDQSIAYNCIITGPCGSVVSDSCALFVSQPAVITSQPASINRCVGESASLSVGATGTISGFQWRKGTTNLTNGGNISGVNTATLTISSVSAADDASNYNCVVSGPCGANVVSANADINVQSPLALVGYASSTGSGIVCQGSNLSLQIVTTGTATAWQWRRGTTPLVNGGRISGVNTPTLAITNFGPSDAGVDYNCVVNGPCGNFPAPAVELINRVPITITQNPSSLTVCPGDSAAFTVTATGTSPTFQWRSLTSATPLADGPGISGTTTGTLTLSGPALLAGGYVCDVTNSCGTQTSTTATLTVRSIAMTTPPVGTTVVVPNGFVLSGTATTAPASAISYVWKRNNVAITSGGRFSVSSDGRTLTVLSSIADDLSATFAFSATDVCGTTLTNIVPVVAVGTTESEPNNDKSTANLRSLGPDATVGGSTQSATDIIDYFRLILPQGPGISRWQLALVSGNQTIRLRGLSQTNGVPDAGSNPSFATGGPSQPLVWYTSGTATPQLYVSVESAPSSALTQYALRLTRTAVEPDVFPAVIPPGSVTFTTAAVAGNSDTEMWLYDSQFNTIEGAGNDGVPGNNSVEQFTRELVAGDYYLAHSRFNLANSFPNPPDDNYRNDSILEFPGVTACSRVDTAQNLTFRAGPAGGTLTSFTPTALASTFAIAWTKITIGNLACSPADIANTDGDPAPDSVLDNGDFNLFFQSFFLPSTDPARLAADIANTDGDTTVTGGGPDGAIDNGDFNAFFALFFQGCP